MKRILAMVCVLGALLSSSGAARADFVPRQKECVGDPPRQTEDPLSPPCVTYFDEDNGGATYSGVRSTEVSVALYNDLGIKGDMNAPWSPSDETVRGHPFLVRTLKAQARFFSRRFMTYGRNVRVTAKSAASTTLCPQQTADSYIVRRDINPFAVIVLGNDLLCFAKSMAADFKVPAFLFGTDISRSELDDYRPYIWSFMPDANTEAGYSASLICRELSGHPARFAHSDALAGMNRTFGLIRSAPALAVNERITRLSDLLVSALSSECGAEPASIDDYRGFQDASVLMAKYKAMNITTVVCYCPPESLLGTVPSLPWLQTAASSIDYHPEWFFDHASRMDDLETLRTYASPSESAFGVTATWRAPEMRQQYASKAFLSVEPAAQFDEEYNFSIYHSLLQIFTGVQTAGPNLTPETVERGMFTWARTDREDPFSPVGGDGPYASEAIGDYSFIDTGMAWWWDPNGTEPGGTPAHGCLRVANEGRRAYPGGWPLGDDGLYASSAPCTAAVVHHGLPKV